MKKTKWEGKERVERGSWEGGQQQTVSETKESPEIRYGALCPQGYA